jgi:uncharacterized protein (TIGR03084 family)
VIRELVDDLAAEQDELDAFLVNRSPSEWSTVTPSAPWTVGDTISHLAFFDERQVQAITDAEGFTNEINQRVTGGNDEYMSIGVSRGRAMTPTEVLAWWRQARAAEIEAFLPLQADQKIPWYGPPMKARSAVIARMMETWAHGQDVVDALGLTREPTDRLFQIAELGVKTFSWSFTNHGLEVPSERVRVALRGPSGSTVVWNDEWSNSITGPVDEFCLVVTQRRNYLDTALVIEGEVARRWMEIAQIFAGPPGPGRAPISSQTSSI